MKLKWTVVWSGLEMFVSDRRGNASVLLANAELLLFSKCSTEFLEIVGVASYLVGVVDVCCSCWVVVVERRSPGWRPGRRLAIYRAYWAWKGLCVLAGSRNPSRKRGRVEGELVAG